MLNDKKKVNKVLNIERYKEKLKKCKGVALDCQIYKLRKECKEVESSFCLSNPCSACREDNIEWLLSEYKEPTLTEEEKAYLSAVIKPFKKHVKTIKKYRPLATTLYIITINVENESNYDTFVRLPPFEKSSGMYEGMEENRAYTLEELGL